MSELSVLTLIFVSATVVTLLAFRLLGSTRDEGDTDEPARPILGPVTRFVGDIVPSTAKGRQKIQQDLWLAGYYHTVALDNFLAVRSLLVLFPLGLAVGFALVSLGIPWMNGRGQEAFDTSGRMVLVCMGIGVVCAVLGFAVPRVMLASEAKERGERLRRGVPTLMDTLGLCLSTGSGLPESFRRSGEAIRRGYPDLAQDVRIVHKQAQLRSMDHALDQWRKRTPLPEVGSLCFLLGQSDRLGTDATKGLFELSGSYRVNTRQRAEAAANRTNFYLLFPTVLCLLMAAAIILVGPSVLKINDERQQVLESIDRATERANDIKDDVQQRIGEMQRQRAPGMQANPTPPAVPEPGRN